MALTLKAARFDCLSLCPRSLCRQTQENFGLPTPEMLQVILSEESFYEWH